MQRIAVFRRGSRLRFVRGCGELFGQARALSWWRGEPCCLVRAGFSRAALIVAASADRARREIDTSCAPARIKGMAAMPDADGLVVVHEHPDGARIYATRGQEVVGERVYPEARSDVHVATDGVCVVVSEPCGATLWRFDDPSLGSRRPWSLASLADALGVRPTAITGLLGDADTLRIATDVGWSRWRWDGELLAAWPAPPRLCSLVAWHGLSPIVHMASERLGDASELVAWDLAGGPARSLGPAHDWPRGACSSDGRWLVVDRVTAAGRGLELWDLLAARQVERLETRRRAVQAVAFAPDGHELAVATMDDLFVLRVEAC